MAAFIRWFFAGAVFFFGSIIVLVIALFRQGDPRVGLIWTRWIPPVGLWFLGVKIEIRHQERIRAHHPAVLIANHQHALDMFTCASTLCTPTVAVGKQEVVNVPFFGTLFRMTGQILINRKDHSSAMESMAEAAQAMVERNLSVWMFPEGTRSRGRPMQPFKKGAFHLAIQAQRPIVPIAVSSYHKTLNMNRLFPGRVILEILEPIATIGKSSDDIELLVEQSAMAMRSAIARIDRELISAIQV